MTQTYNESDNCFNFATFNLRLFRYISDFWILLSILIILDPSGGAMNDLMDMINYDDPKYWTTYNRRRRGLKEAYIKKHDYSARDLDTPI